MIDHIKTTLLILISLIIPNIAFSQEIKCEINKPRGETVEYLNKWINPSNNHIITGNKAVFINNPKSLFLDQDKYIGQVLENTSDRIVWKYTFKNTLIKSQKQSFENVRSKDTKFYMKFDLRKTNNRVFFEGNIERHKYIMIEAQGKCNIFQRNKPEKILNDQAVKNKASSKTQSSLSKETLEYEIKLKKLEEEKARLKAKIKAEKLAEENAKLQIQLERQKLAKEKAIKAERIKAQRLAEKQKLKEAAIKKKKAEEARRKRLKEEKAKAEKARKQRILAEKKKAEAKARKEKLENFRLISDNFIEDLKKYVKQPNELDIFKIQKLLSDYISLKDMKWNNKKFTTFEKIYEETLKDKNFSIFSEKQNKMRKEKITRANENIILFLKNSINIFKSHVSSNLGAKSADEAILLASKAKLLIENYDINKAIELVKKINQWKKTNNIEESFSFNEEAIELIIKLNAIILQKQKLAEEEKLKVKKAREKRILAEKKKVEALRKKRILAEKKKKEEAKKLANSTAEEICLYAYNKVKGKWISLPFAKKYIDEAKKRGINCKALEQMNIAARKQSIIRDRIKDRMTNNSKNNQMVALFSCRGRFNDLNEQYVQAILNHFNNIPSLSSPFGISKFISTLNRRHSICEFLNIRTSTRNRNLTFLKQLNSGDYYGQNLYRSDSCGSGGCATMVWLGSL